MIRLSSTLLILAWLAALGLFGALGAHAYGGCWYNFAPDGAVNGQGLLEDVVSRSGKPAYFKQKYANDIPTMCHEATHLANGAICNSLGRQAFYVGGGRCCILPEPRIQLPTVAQYVPQQYRDELYRFYLVQQPATQPILRDMPLYVFDEWSAAINGWQAAREGNVSDTGDAQMARQFCYFADALVEATKRHDPQYANLRDMEVFVSFQKQRVAKLALTPGQTVPRAVGGVKALEERTWNAAFGGGSAGGQRIPPSPKPLPAPPTGPVAQPAAPAVQCNCVNRIAAFELRIQQLEAALKNAGQAKPATINFLGVDDKIIATTTVTPGGTTNVKLPPIHMRVLDQRGAGYSTEYQPAPLGSYVTLPFGPAQ